METVKFYKDLEKILDKPRNEINEDYVFSNTDWDSLTIMAVAASVDTLYDVVIPVKKLSKCETVKQILDIVREEKKEEG